MSGNATPPTLKEWEKLVIDFDPFSGDMGDVGDRVLRDKLVVCRRGGRCHACCQNFKPKDIIRSMVIIWVSDGMKTYKFCHACCEAMAASWADQGEALTARNLMRGDD